jgi:hypothetical protein
MLPQEFMYLIVVTELSIKFLKILDLVEVCILNLWRKIFLYLNVFYVSRESAKII